MKRYEFEKAVFEAVTSGNVPPFQRRLVPVALRASGKHGDHEGVVNVLCDYLAIGSDEDFLRIPMTPVTAQRIASLTGCVLPTPKLVDEIYRQAKNKLPPKWIEGGPNLENRWDYASHNKDVEAQRRSGGRPLGELLAGVKKDIVICNKLVKRPRSVAIYGWHIREGRVIQKLSLVHSRLYADYSHGVRLVSASMTVDGREARVVDVLRDRELSGLLTTEGPARVVGYAVGDDLRVAGRDGGAASTRRHNR
jgi:hypothetical protein